MSDSEQPISSGAEPAGDKPAARPGTRRRGRRGGRGRRKTFPARPGEDAPTPEEQDSAAPASAPVETSAATPATAAPEAGATQPPQPPARAERPDRPPRPERPASEPLPPRRPPIAVRPLVERPLVERVQRLTERVARVEPEHRVSAIHQAIDEVMAVVDVLKRAVDQMEEVLELVEVAERQKLADEREIENLRRALRQFSDRSPDRPRDQQRDQREQRGGREQRDQRAPRAPRPPESREQRERRESQDTPDPRGAKDFREPHPEPDTSASSEPARNEDEPQQGS